MNVKIFDRACKYIEKMYWSRREDWTVRKLYIKPNVYLQIEWQRVTQEDIDNCNWVGWQRGAPYDLQLYIVDKDGDEKDGCTVQYDFIKNYKRDLEYLLGMYS